MEPASEVAGQCGQDADANCARNGEAMKYKITITPTADGREYMQIISADQLSTNIVLIGEFEVQDTRAPKKPKGKP
jgi:hypothetical protein